MRRRDFFILIGGATLALSMLWPFAASAQQAAKPVVGFLGGRSPGESANVVAAFHRGLSESGYVEGQNVTIEYRWAEGQIDRLPALATDLVRRPVTVIAATGGTASGLAAKAATSTVPIVFIGSDPVRFGLVTSLNRPGGNLTGVNTLLQDMEGKRLGLLRELVPTAALISSAHQPARPRYQKPDQGRSEDIARVLRQRIHVLHASSQQDISAAFTTLAELKAEALLVAGNPFFNSRREQIVTLVNHYKIPAIYEVREFAAAGGLMSYGTSLPDGYRQVGIYVGRILKGEKPADLPVMQSTQFEFVINLKTAKALGIDVPGALSARADEIIE